MSVKAKDSRAFSVSSGMVLQANILVGKTPLSSRINVRFLGLDNLEKTTWRRFAVVKLTEEERKLRHAAYQRAWRKKHPEAVANANKRYHKTHHENRIAYQKNYRATHRDDIKVAGKIYYDRHRERIRARAKNYRDTNREEARAKHRIYQKAYRLRHYEALLIRSKNL